MPVHNAGSALKRCLTSLLLHTPATVSIRVFDDASSDREVQNAVSEAIHARSNLVFSRNSIRSGYVRTANRGLSESEGCGAILLNSDTIVTPGWYEKLVATGDSRDDVATVTPVSNCAGPFSILIRNRCSSLPKGLSTDEMGRLIERVSPHRRPPVPTGHGFCMLVKAEAIQKVGLFDEAKFGLGYGEENDFCLRATCREFVHLIDDATFVYHEGGSSFGRLMKPLRQKRAYRLLRRLYPEYREKLSIWLEEDPLADLRSRVAVALSERGASEGRLV